MGATDSRLPPLEGPLPRFVCCHKVQEVPAAEAANHIRLELRRFVAPEFFFGAGALDLTGRYAASYRARKVLLITDPGVVRAGWTKVVERSLEEAGIAYAVFDGVTPNPRDHEVMDGVQFYRDEGCDVIVAVGGGSPMDCAKAIGILSSNDGHVLSFEGVDQARLPGPPMIFAPTTAGTGSDLSQFGIITDTCGRRKIAIVGKLVIPEVSLIDAGTTVTMDPALTASTGMNVLTNAVEAYVSTASSPVTDLFALEAMRLVSKSLPDAVEQPKNLRAREQMMLASLYAGLAFSSASLGMVHAMAHGVGGLLDAPHGVCAALLMEHGVDFNYEAAPQRYSTVAGVLGLPAAGLTESNAKAALIEKLAQLREQVGIRGRLRDLGLSKEDITVVAESALDDPCLVTNPRTVSLDELRRCYEQAF